MTVTEDQAVELLRRALGAEPFDQPAPPEHARLVDRAGRADYGRWLAGAQSAGGCVRPVRLRPSMLRADPATGELAPANDESPDAPDGVIYKACGDRRSSVCPPCSERYRADTWQLIAAGLRGGKGVPAEVAGHPAVFLTLTAPSFGLVHSRRTASTGRVLPCRPRRKPAPCQHGRDLRCSRHHDQDEAVLGLPLCLDCYDHDGQIVWNAHVGELWRRTVIGLRRELARVARARGSTVRLSYAKVAEFQRRGVVHLHALLRLDGIDPADPSRVVPPAGVTTADLDAAVRQAAGTFGTEPHPDRQQGWRIGWGEQLDVRPLRLRGDGDVTDRAVVAYLAKYATKSTETTGHVSKRLTASTVDYYADPHTHAGRLIDACWTLGGADGWDGLRRWAHMLGFGGHFGTRSRRYSTTLRALRAARRVWRRRELVETREHTEKTTLVVGAWTYAGSGWRTTADALLATSAAARARERRQTARDESTTRIGPPKSRAGDRVVGLPAALVPVLVEHLAQYVGPAGDALLFTGAKGGPLRRSTFNRLVGWAEATAAVGAPGLHFHDLRHTGNHLAAQVPGTTVRDLMARMGHDNERAAMIYLHRTQGADRRIADALPVDLGQSDAVRETE